MERIDYSSAYWQHVQLRQIEIIRYLSGYINLNQGLAIGSSLYDFSDRENDPWIYAHVSEDKASDKQVFFSKGVHMELENMPFSTNSLDNIIIGIGVSLHTLSALLNECYTILKPEGFLIIFYPNKMNALWWFSTTLRKWQKITHTPYPMKIIAVAKQWHFSFIESFSFSLMPPSLLKRLPFLIGKWDSWCYKFPLPIGQANMLILQKKQQPRVWVQEKKASFTYAPKLGYTTATTSISSNGFK